MNTLQSLVKRNVPLWVLLVVLFITGICACLIGIFIGVPSSSGKTRIVAEALTLTATAKPSLTFTPTIIVTIPPTSTNTPSTSPTSSYTLTSLNTPTITPTPTNTGTPTATPNTTQTAQAKLREDKEDGFYLVNVDIAPGVWRSTGSGDNCYWATTAKTGDIIDNHFGLAGGTAFISPNTFQVEFNGCGTWVFVSAP